MYTGPIPDLYWIYTGRTPCTYKKTAVFCKHPPAILTRMAKQRSTITLSGKLGDKVYYQRNGKNLVRSAAAFHHLSANSEKSGTEFGRASKAAALVKQGFHDMINIIGDNRFTLRLTTRFIKVIGTGYSKPKGEREVTDGDIALLKGFELNRFTASNRICAIEPVIDINPSADITVTIPRFNLEHTVIEVPRAETLVIQSCCYAFDFKNGKKWLAPLSDLEISLHKTWFPGCSLQFPAGSLHNKVLVFAMGFYFLSTDHFPIANRNYLGGRIIESVLIRNRRIIRFVYPEKNVQPVTKKIQKTGIAWRFSEK